MTEQTTPIPWRSLRLVRGGTKGGTTDPGTEPVPPPGTEGGTQGAAVPLPVPPGTGTEVVPLTPAERAQLAAKHWAELAANGAGQMFFHPDRIGHSLYHGHPGSLAEHRAYIRSREWVPPDLDGKGAAFVAGSGVVYHLLVARPLKAACLIVSAAADKPLRLLGLVALVLIFVIAVVPHIHI